VWIVLLDHSGSMSDPFEQTSTTASRRARVAEAEIKLDAAREVLREEVRELQQTDPAMPLAIFAFTEQVALIYDGPVGDLETIDRALNSLRPEDGTDIAAALNAAADYQDRRSNPGLTHLMLISDGQSDRVTAMAAARRCLERNIALSMLLIDPTEEGKAFALDVVRGVGGTYQPVVSREDLRSATKTLSDGRAGDVARADRYLESATQEVELVASEVSDRERVQFTAGYPGRIAPAHDYLLRVYLHLESETKEVLARLDQAADEFGARPRKTDAESNQRIPIGTRLEVTPRIHLIGVSPPQQQIAWLGSLEDVSFRIHYAGSERVPEPCSGFIDSTAGGLLVAQLPVSIAVEAGDAWIERRTVEMISRVFASYSHKDEEIVRACKAAYRALGIQLFIDKDDLLSGQKWRPVLRQSIADHDLFQLYWSQAASESTEVANEWHLAREIAPQRAVDFIRPLYWSEPMPHPPGELSDLHFGRLDLTTLNVQKTVSTAIPAAHPPRLEATFPIIDAVDSDPAWIRWLQDRMREVVPFIENLVGVRYFPPVTFLVDEHIVRTARAQLTVDGAAADDDSSEYVIAILQALALAFHVGKLASEKTEWNQRAAFYDVRGDEARADYDHVVHMTEWVFAGPVRNHLAGKNVLKDERKSLEEVIEEDSSWDVASMIEETLALATPDERAAVSNAATPQILNDLRSFTDDKKKVAEAAVLASDLPRLAERYRVFKFFHHVAKHSLRSHTSFRDYLADLIQHWLDYARTATAKRPGEMIKIGYSAPMAALDWLSRMAPEIQFASTRTGDDQREKVPQADFEMPIESYVRCVQRLAPMLLEVIAKGGRSKVAGIVSESMATHGIYLPAGAVRPQSQLTQSLVNRGWPAATTLPEQSKVLLCGAAIQRFEEKLVATGRDQKEARDLALRFSLSVLIHEHFHAALATGLDSAGRSALGHDHPDRWVIGRALNESLAVWCERHFFREDPAMSEIIDAYMANGDYPVWPYRGGERLESMFVAGGVPAVRGWMHHLRDDPENAQSEFDQRVGGV
jgi:hypothetical protein